MKDTLLSLESVKDGLGTPTVKVEAKMCMINKEQVIIIGSRLHNFYFITTHFLPQTLILSPYCKTTI